MINLHKTEAPGGSALLTFLKKLRLVQIHIIQLCRAGVGTLLALESSASSLKDIRAMALPSSPSHQKQRQTMQVASVISPTQDKAHLHP